MILDNPRHERFAQMVAAGKEQGRAYEEAGFVARGKSADESASRLVKDSQVANRINEIRMQAEAMCRMSKKEVLDFLVEVILTPAGDVQDDHKLCQAYKHTDSERSIKMPDKLRAVEQLAKMCGYNAPEKVEHEAGDTLTKFLSSIRRRKSDG